MSSFKPVFVMTSVLWLCLLLNGVAGAEPAFLPESRASNLKSTHHVTVQVHHGGLGRDLTFVFHNAEIYRMPSAADELWAFDDPSADFFQSDADRPETLEIVGLMIQEVDMLAGIRELTDKMEHRFDRYIQKLKLRGGVSFSRDESRDWAFHENLQFDGGIFFGIKRALAGNRLVRKIMPNYLNWRISSDLNGKYVIGELELGRFLTMEGSLGSEPECCMIVEFPF